MKKIILLFFVLSACKAQAQTPWYLGGNTVGAPTTFGTLDNYDINFVRGGNAYGYLGDINMGLGYHALNSTGVGVSNCAFGYSSLQANTSGNLNNAFGYSAMIHNTTGYGNNAFGSEALRSNTSGYANNAFGERSLYNNVTGVLNCGIGGTSLYANTTGSYNMALGESSLGGNTTGSSNVAIGFGSGGALTTGSSNIFIGSGIGPNISNISSNQLNIGGWIFGYNGSIGIGAPNPNNKLEITVGTAGYSGLRFTNLPNSAASITNPTSKVLSVDANGDVILVDDQSGSGSVTAAQGLTFDGTSVVLGDDCGNGGGAFSNNREINMAGNNLYFNSSEAGKLYMGAEGCKKLVTRLEIGTKGLTTVNGYDPAASPSGLRFTDLTSDTKPIHNETGGVLSLDKDGDVIWVQDETGGSTDGDFWSLHGNSISAGNFLGTTNDMDLIFERGGVISGQLGVTNTTFGLYSFASNTTGTRNSALGAYALSHNTTGTDNIGVGFQSLFFNTTGVSNTANGITAMYNNISGYSNTATGKATLFSNNTGNSNTATGITAMYNNTTGNNNTATGANSLYSNTTGDNNTATGEGALFLNTTGTMNEANGVNALIFNTTGNRNTAAGANALSANTTGSNNTAIGYNTGGGITTGSGNTILGSNVTFLPAALTNTIILADGTGTKRLFIDNGGNAGLATNTPTAALHVNCTGIPLTGASNVRFENLQSGTGNILVIDANGYVKKSSSTALMPQEDVDDLRKELNDTKKELNETRSALEELKTKVNALLSNSNSAAPDNSGSSLTIIPTPFSSNAKAVYSIGNFKGNATLQVVDAKGSLIKKFALSAANGAIELENMELSSGVVFFNMVVDGRIVLSKKSVKL